MPPDVSHVSAAHPVYLRHQILEIPYRLLRRLHIVAETESHSVSKPSFFQSTVQPVQNGFPEFLNYCIVIRVVLGTDCRFNRASYSIDFCEFYA